MVFTIANIDAKIRLFTFHYNRPDFIEIQHKTLNKFLKEKDDYELIVFNDATDEKLKDQIEQTCQNLGLQCVEFPQEQHYIGSLVEKMKPYGLDGSNGSVRHCQLVQYALDNFGYDHDDIVGMMEADVFLIREFSIREALKDYDIIGAKQTDRQDGGYEYIWIGLTFFDMKKLVHPKELSFNLTFAKGYFLDSGGSTYRYLKKHPTVKAKKFTRVPITSLPRKSQKKLQALGYRDKEIKFLQQLINYESETPFVSMEFHLDNHFLHQAWSRYSSDLDSKSIAVKNYLNDILSD